MVDDRLLIVRTERNYMSAHCKSLRRIANRLQSKSATTKLQLAILTKFGYPSRLTAIACERAIVTWTVIARANSQSKHVDWATGSRLSGRMPEVAAPDVGE